MVFSIDILAFMNYLFFFEDVDRVSISHVPGIEIVEGALDVFVGIICIII